MKPRIVIVMEGGVIQEVLSDQPVRVLIKDYDVDGIDPLIDAVCFDREGLRFYARIEELDRKPVEEAANQITIINEIFESVEPQLSDHEILVKRIENEKSEMLDAYIKSVKAELDKRVLSDSSAVVKSILDGQRPF